MGGSRFLKSVIIENGNVLSTHWYVVRKFGNSGGKKNCSFGSKKVILACIRHKKLILAPSTKRLLSTHFKCWKFLKFSIAAVLLGFIGNRINNKAYCRIFFYCTQGVQYDFVSENYFLSRGVQDPLNKSRISSIWFKIQIQIRFSNFQNYSDTDAIWDISVQIFQYPKSL